MTRFLDDKRAQIRKKNVKSIRRIVQNEIEKERLIKKKLEEDAIYHASPEYIKETNERQIRQKMNNYQQEVAKNLLDSRSEMIKELLELIKSKLDITYKPSKKQSYCSNVTFEQIKEVIDLCLPALEKLNKLSDNEVINSCSNNLHYTEYEKFFNELIEFDIRFAYFAPFKSFDRTAVKNKMEDLSEDIKLNLNERKMKFNKDNQADYLSENKTNLNQIDFEVQTIIDKEEEVEFKSKYEIVCATEVMANDIYNFIKGELKRNENGVFEVKDIIEIVKFCRTALYVLRNKSFDADLNEVSGWDRANPYIELFNNLMELDIRFAMFAPKASLNRLDIYYDQMSEQERKIMLKIFKEKGLWDDVEFKAVYYSTFCSVESLEL